VKMAVEKEAGLCNKTTANSVKMAVEKEAELCNKRTANSVKMAVEKQAGLCKKSIDAFNKTMALEAKSCKKSIADAVDVEKVKETKWCKKNSVMVEKVGPFKPSSNNKIGEITKYYHNYEFSMDLRLSESDLQEDVKQLLVVGTNGQQHHINSLFYFWTDMLDNQIVVHFYTGKRDHHNVNLGHKSIVFLNWHKLQAIQSSNDGVNCKQEIRINGKSIWSQSLKCPRTMKNTQQIYLSGNGNGYSRLISDAEVKISDFLLNH